MTDVGEAWLGLLLFLVLPGLAWSRALFPEWRFRGSGGRLHAVETAAMAIFLSAAFTILIGSVLSEVPGWGFSASWSDPRVELILLVLTGIGTLLAFVRGAFRGIPLSVSPEGSGGETVDLTRLWRSMDKVAEQESALRHSLHREKGNPVRVQALTEDLRHLQEERRRRRIEEE